MLPPVLVFVRFSSILFSFISFLLDHASVILIFRHVVWIFLSILMLCLRYTYYSNSSINSPTIVKAWLRLYDSQFIIFGLLIVLFCVFFQFYYYIHFIGSSVMTTISSVYHSLFIIWFLYLFYSFHNSAGWIHLSRSLWRVLKLQNLAFLIYWFKCFPSFNRIECLVIYKWSIPFFIMFQWFRMWLRILYRFHLQIINHYFHINFKTVRLVPTTLCRRQELNL